MVVVVMLLSLSLLLVVGLLVPWLLMVVPHGCCLPC